MILGKKKNYMGVILNGDDIQGIGEDEGDNDITGNKVEEGAEGYGDWKRRQGSLSNAKNNKSSKDK